MLLGVLRGKRFLLQDLAPQGVGLGIVRIVLQRLIEVFQGAVVVLVAQVELGPFDVRVTRTAVGADQQKPAKQQDEKERESLHGLGSMGREGGVCDVWGSSTFLNYKGKTRQRF